jgi:transposase-like protein
MEDRQPRNRRQFTAEFKRDAVELARTSDRPIAEIARELGIYDSTLRRCGWAANHKRVERLMRCHGIVGYRVPPAPIPDQPDAGAAPPPDRLGRLFDPTSRMWPGAGR